MSLLMNHASDNPNTTALASRPPLYTIDPRPWRHQSQYTSHDIYQHIRCVILVLSRPPELVQPSTANDQRGIYFQPIAPERRVFEIFFKLLEVALDADVRQVGHHVCDDFEAGVFGEVERFGDGADGVSTVSVSGDVFVNGLHANLETRAAVSEHLAVMNRGFGWCSDVVEQNTYLRWGRRQ